MYEILYDFVISLPQERTDDKKKVFQLAAGKRVKASFPQSSQKEICFWCCTGAIEVNVANK